MLGQSLGQAEAPQKTSASEAQLEQVPGMPMTRFEPSLIRRKHPQHAFESTYPAVSHAVIVESG